MRCHLERGLRDLGALGLGSELCSGVGGTAKADTSGSDDVFSTRKDTLMDLENLSGSVFGDQ